MSMDRIPVTVIEIDQDQCALTFSEGACTATGEPCYQTRATCKAKDAYTLGDPLTLRFSMRDRAEGFDEYVIPSITSVSTDPTRINVGGRRGREKPLGMRSQARVQAVDHPHSDLLVDPYRDQRSYDPMERSTFWAKWLRRNPFYANRPMRIKEGFAGQALSEMQTRHYVLDKIEGPDASGRVRIDAQDVLRLADDDKAKAPQLSRGILLSDVTETASSLVVTRGTLTEYTQYNTSAIRIGDEVIRYSSVTELGSGDLEFTGLQRGTDGTDPQSHDAEDSVQACLEYVGEEPWVIARDLLVDFGDIDSALIPFADWQDQGTTWLAGFNVTRLLTEPEGVTTLLGELCEQCLFYIWWDDLTQQIRLKAVAPAIGSVPLITEQRNLIADSTTISVSPEQRATEVWVNFLPLDVTETGDERKHYRRTRVRVAEDSSSPFQYGDRRVYEVFSSWLVNDAQVGLLTFRLLARYRRPPQYISFELDIKDRDLDLGEPFDIDYRGFVDGSGARELVRYQLISKHESPPGQRIKCEAQKFDFDIDSRFGNWMVDAAPVYTDATEQERATGFFWSDIEGRMTNDDQGYVWS